MTNQFNNEPVINQLLSLITQQSVDEAGLTGTALDMGEPSNKKHIALLDAGALTDVDGGVFVKLEESHDNVTYTFLAQFSTFNTDNFRQFIEFTRTKRYLRAVLSVEAAGVAAVPITVLLIL